MGNALYGLFTDTPNVHLQPGSLADFFQNALTAPMMNHTVLVRAHKNKMHFYSGKNLMTLLHIQHKRLVLAWLKLSEQLLMIIILSGKIESVNC